jgi:FkbM family methyltransferase
MPIQHCEYTNIASVFWGFYESAELRLINKYLVADLPVIELGGSLGIVSSHIAKKLKAPLVVVEANPYLVNTIIANTSKHNSNNINIQVLNKAVSYFDKMVSFSVSKNNTESSVISDGSDGSQSNTITVNTITLEELTADLAKYTLVCDIEGAEVELISSGVEALKKVNHIFMEVHAVQANGIFYKQQQLINKLTELGFELVEQDGYVVYMNKGNGK